MLQSTISQRTKQVREGRRNQSCPGETRALGGFLQGDSWTCHFPGTELLALVFGDDLGAKDVWDQGSLADGTVDGGHGMMLWRGRIHPALDPGLSPPHPDFFNSK